MRELISFNGSLLSSSITGTFSGEGGSTGTTFLRNEGIGNAFVGGGKNIEGIEDDPNILGMVDVGASNNPFTGRLKIDLVFSSLEMDDFSSSYVRNGLLKVGKLLPCTSFDSKAGGFSGFTSIEDLT